jgi:hypothetical protein
MMDRADDEPARIWPAVIERDHLLLNRKFVPAVST